MGARKRCHRGTETSPKPVNGVKTVKKKSSRVGSTPTSSSSWSTTVYGLLLLLVLYLAGAVYVYNFVDVPQAIDLIQTRIATVMGYSKAGGLIKTHPPRDSASQGIRDPKSTAEDQGSQPPGGSNEPAESQGDKVTQETKDSNNVLKKPSRSSITNQADRKIQDHLDKADDLFDKGEFQDALNAYTHILTHVSESPRAYYGKAQTLSQLAEKQRSNSLMTKAIDDFLKVLEMNEVPKELYMKAGREASAKQFFMRWNHQAMNTLKKLLEKYPHDLDLKKELGVRYQAMRSHQEAKKMFTEVLKEKPDDGLSLVNLGVIIKTIDRELDTAIPLLQRGIDSGEEGTIKQTYYINLGDAYYRVGEHNKSRKIHELGVEKGLFRSVLQRSIKNIDHLVSQPWWTKQQTGNLEHLQKLEENWMLIRDEGLAQLDPSTGSFLDDTQDLQESGNWKQFRLYRRGRKIEANCKKVPKTCALVEEFTDAISCGRGQIKFSVMHPGVHLWPHCGPTNSRIRSHLGLVVPDGARIRVGEETRTWEEGKFIVFDDSFEHEVWHDGDTLRLVLIIDMWHPDLTKEEKNNIRLRRGSHKSDPPTQGHLRSPSDLHTEQLNRSPMSPWESFFFF